MSTMPPPPNPSGAMPPPPGSGTPPPGQPWPTPDPTTVDVAPVAAAPSVFASTQPPPPEQLDARRGGRGEAFTSAGFGARLLALIIDSVLVGLGSIAIVGVATVVLAVGSSAAPARFVAGALYFLSFAFVVSYYAILEGRGQTVGKRTMRIATVDAEQDHIVGTNRGFLRYIARIPSGSLFYLGYLWMLWDDDQQTWHDKLATTRVIDVG